MKPTKMPADPNRRVKATDDTGGMAKALALAVCILLAVAVAVAVMYVSGSFSMTSVEIRY